MYGILSVSIVVGMKSRFKNSFNCGCKKPTTTTTTGFKILNLNLFFTRL